MSADSRMFLVYNSYSSIIFSLFTYRKKKGRFGGRSNKGPAFIQPIRAI